MTTAIVILNWNGRDFLRKYLPCLLNSVKGYDGVDVIVADNASTDDSMEVLKSEFPSVKTISLKKNHGFAGGYNRALRNLEHDLFILLNSDVEVSDGWLDHLTEWMELHKDCGICAPILHSTAERNSFEYAGAAGGYLDRLFFPFCRGRVMSRVEKDCGQYNDPCEVMWVTGAALVIRSEVFRQVGGFCEDFFAHMEEIDLCWRARLEGWKVNVVPRSVVYHVGGGTLPNNSPIKLYLNYRNNLLMMQRCLPRTIAIENLFSFIAKTVLPDEGPDMIHNCECIFNGEYDSSLRNDLITVATEMGSTMCRIMIFKRMMVDFCAAMAYMLSGKFRYAAAVFKAHSDFRKMRDRHNIKCTAKYLRPIIEGERDDIAYNLLCWEDCQDNMGGKTFKLKGIWSKWIVTQSILKKEAIFAEIKENLR